MSEIIDNSISQYAKLHNIPMYEVSDLRGTIIVLKNETDYLTLLKKNNVGALFFSYSVTDDSDEIDADIDYEEVQHQLEEDYKFLPVFADLLSADEYISRLDGIIDKHLDSKHPNGVHKRVYEQLPVVNDIYKNPGKYRNTELSHAVDVALRELALEKVRKEKYPHFPSRMAALYVSKTFKEAEQWGDYFAKLGRPTYGIAKIRVRGNVFEGDAYKCFDGCIDEAENVRMAEIYWLNGPNEDGRDPIVEILADGDIEVIEIVKEINANIV